MGCGHQNECTFGCARNFLNPDALLAAETGVERCVSYGPSAGNRHSPSLRGYSREANLAQFTLAFPFLPVNAYGYIGRAFEFTRQFLFKWTVNWRFVGAETFLSHKFSLALAIINLSLLLFFFATRWIRPSGLSLPAFLSTIFNPPSSEAQQHLSLRVTPSFIFTTVLGSLSIGMLCARSLHYQFFAYIAWSTPFLLWRSGMHPFMIYALWAAQEWAWNVYPSTNMSSMVVVGCLIIQVFGTWWGTRKDFADVSNVIGREGREHKHLD